jgi:hypothetical protein
MENPMLKFFRGRLMLFLATCAPLTPPLAAREGTAKNLVAGWQVHDTLLTDIPCLSELPDTPFELTAAFKRENALILSISSWLSHSEDEELIKTQLMAWGFEDILLMGRDNKGIKGFVAEHPQVLLAAFRGTESLGDVFDDAMFQTASAGELKMPGRVHFGMRHHYRKLAADFNRFLDARTDTAKPLVMTGHSLGGAVALIAALDRSQRGQKPLVLYTLAQPKVGDEEFQNFAGATLGDRYFRIFHRDDMTPHIAPSRHSAALFSQLITRKLPLARRQTEQLVRRLGYGSHSGASYSFGPHAPLLRERSSELNIEADYWLRLQQELGEIRSLDDLKMLQQRHLAVHVPSNYICSISRE